MKQSRLVSLLLQCTTESLFSVLYLCKKNKGQEEKAMFNVFHLNALIQQIPPSGINQMVEENLTILQHYRKEETMTKTQLSDFIGSIRNILVQNDKKSFIFTHEINGNSITAERERLTILLEQAPLEDFLTYSEITLNVLETASNYFPDNRDLSGYIREISTLHIDFLTVITPKYDISDPNVQ